MQLRRCLRHLLPKKAPWLQGTRSLDKTHRIQHPRDKKEAAKKSLDLKKVLPSFLHQHDTTASRRAKTPCCPWRRCTGTTKSKPRVSKGPR